MSNSYTEDHLVEQPAIELMQHELGWDVVNCFGEWDGGKSAHGRDGKREVVLTGRLKPALLRLNPDLPVEAIEGAVEEICRDRTALSLAEANREIDKLLKQGVKVSFPDQEHGGQRVEVLSVVDWEVPENNDFLLGSQFWVAGELYLRRTDLVGFVNGLPLVLIELKKPGVNVREGFDKNLRDYKQTIPQLFHYNALLLVSNGVQSKIGSLTAEWEHFGDWKKATSEEDVAGISLETLLRGTCEKGRLLDLIENFTRFSDSKGGVSKLLAKNHQFLGVNRAVEALRVSTDGRIGVFWLQQGFKSPNPGNPRKIGTRPWQRVAEVAEFHGGLGVSGTPFRVRSQWPSKPGVVVVIAPRHRVAVYHPLMIKICGFLIRQSLKALAFMHILIGRGGWRSNEQDRVA